MGISKSRGEVEPQQSQTAFQVHYKHSPELKQLENIFDFSEYKLYSLIKKIKNRRIISSLRDVLSSYQSGKIKVAWRSGVPVFLTLDEQNSD